jgi:uncharacterized protein YjbJ (UPF0337 family)
MADRGDQIAGKAKEAAGKITGDEKLESEGRVQHETEDTKEKIQEAKDKAKGAVEGVKESFKD